MYSLADPSEFRLSFLKEEDAQNLAEFGFNSSLQIEEANNMAIEKSGEADVRVKDMVMTLMKGAATVGKIFPNKPDELSITHGTVFKLANGSYEIPDIVMNTDSESRYYIVLNVRGVETEYTDSGLLLDI